MIAWSLFHHLLSGVRFLLIDTGTGVDRKPARWSAWAVNLTGLLLVLVYIGWLL
jgi:succinate dehydrogenase/fumarate reductase cytochrome b subunit